MKKLFILLCLLLLPVCGQATTYYVDYTLGADCSGGASDAYSVANRDCSADDGTIAYNDLYSVNQVVSAGDVVYLRGGTGDYEVYDVTTNSGAGEGIQPDNSGTGPDNVITYSTYGSEMVHLQGVADSGTSCYGILLYYKDYIKVTGVSDYNLKISEMSAGLIIGATTGVSETAIATGNEIAHVWVTDINLSSSWANHYQSNAVWKRAQYNHVHDCKFTDLGYQVYGSVYADGFVLGKEYAYSAADDYYNVIEDCEFGRGGHSVFEFGSIKYTMFRNNYVHNEEWIDVGGTDVSFRAGFATGREANTELVFVENSRFGYGGETSTNGAPLQPGPAMKWAMNDAVLRHNSFFGAASSGFYFSTYANTSPTGNYLYNNTFFYNGYDRPAYAALYYETPNSSWEPYADNVVKNNLFWDNENSGDTYAGIMFNNETYAAAIACPSSSSQGCNEFSNNFNGFVAPASEVDPVFTNESLADPDSWTLPNLNLQSSSTAINGGTYLTQANGSGSGSSTLIVDDAKYFQDGEFGSASGITVANWPNSVDIQADHIAIGTVGNTVQISSINYSTNTITLASAMTWSDDANIWLYKDSDGTVVLVGSEPDQGAHEYGAGAVPSSSGITTGNLIIEQFLASIRRY